MFPSFITCASVRLYNLVFKRNQSGQLLQVFARNNASILDIISLNCAPETLRRLSKVLRRLFMIDSTLKCAPETSTCAPETFSVLKFAPAKTCSKSARQGARCPFPPLFSLLRTFAEMTLQVQCSAYQCMAGCHLMCHGVTRCQPDASRSDTVKCQF